MVYCLVSCVKTLVKRLTRTIQELMTYVRDILKTPALNTERIPKVDLRTLRQVCQWVVHFLKEHQMPGVSGTTRVFSHADLHLTDEVQCSYRLLCAIGPCFLCHGKREFEVEGR